MPWSTGDAHVHGALPFAEHIFHDTFSAILLNYYKRKKGILSTIRTTLFTERHWITLPRAREFKNEEVEKKKKRVTVKEKQKRKTKKNTHGQAKRKGGGEGGGASREERWEGRRCHAHTMRWVIPLALEAMLANRARPPTREGRKAEGERGKIDKGERKQRKMNKENEDKRQE